MFVIKIKVNLQASKSALGVCKKEKQNKKSEKKRRNKQKTLAN